LLLYKGCILLKNCVDDKFPISILLLDGFKVVFIQQANSSNRAVVTFCYFSLFVLELKWSMNLVVHCFHDVFEWGFDIRRLRRLHDAV
jgi:hypothetical protein